MPIKKTCVCGNPDCLFAFYDKSIQERICPYYMRKPNTRNKPTCENCPYNEKCPFIHFSLNLRETNCARLRNAQSKQQEKKIDLSHIDDIQISYDDLTQMAFDPLLPDKLCKKYQRVLLNANGMVKKSKVSWDQLIFLQNPKTKGVRIWLD